MLILISLTKNSFIKYWVVNVFCYVRICTSLALTDILETFYGFDYAVKCIHKTGALQDNIIYH